MFLDSQSEKILKYLIDINKYLSTDSVSTEKLYSAFADIKQSVILDCIDYLANNGFIDTQLSDNGEGYIYLTYKGRIYFENKSIELTKQQPQSVTINNSSNFNVGNGNNINVTTGITAEEAIKLIEQSTMNDKEAMKEVISLLNDAIVNNKPLKTSKFSKALSHISSLAPLIQMIGGIVVSAIQGHS